ncbi:MAG: ArnT family glycosyltransferase [Gemmataceae bacterium]
MPITLRLWAMKFWSRASSVRPDWAAYAFVLAIASILFLPRLGERGVVSEEFRWAEVAREMRLSGDYFHPTLNGQSYYDKPLGTYWLIVAASFFTGEVNETAVRLPPACAGLLAVFLVMSLARRIYDERTALWSGLILATSFGVMFYARRGTADMETTVGVLAAIWLYERCHTRPGPWMIGLCSIMAITSQMKGLLGFALPGAVLLMHGIWLAMAHRGEAVPRKRWLIDSNRWLAQPWTMVAVPITAGLYLGPYVISSMTGSSDGLNWVYLENIQRFVAPRNHLGPPYLYIFVLLILTAPWSAFLPAALCTAREGRDRLAWSYFLAVFLFFTVSASRRSYYLLPITPAAALLLGRSLALPTDMLFPLARRLRAGGFIICMLGTALAGLLLLPIQRILPLPYATLPALPGWWLFLAGWLVAALAIVGIVLRQIDPRRFVAGVSVAVNAYLFLTILPAAELVRPRREFIEDVAHYRSDIQHVGLCDAQELVFDLHLWPPVPQFPTTQQAMTALQNGEVDSLLISRRRWAEVRVPIDVLATESSQPWESPGALHDKMMLLKLSRPVHAAHAP